MEFIKFILSNFWIWLGFISILGITGTIIYNIFNAILRHRRIMKHGYPPQHCNSDGCFIKED